MNRARALAGVLAVLLSAACGESAVAEPPEVPPPPPHEPMGAQPPDAPAPPPGAAADGAVALGVPDSPPPATAAPPASLANAPLPPLPSQAPQYAPSAPADANAPPPDQWAVTYPTGRWVYADGYGWMWVSNEAGSVVVEGVPYAYLYTAGYGWNWYISPWGFGPYHYGMWVRHPWRPVGWRGGWVARPGVVVRIGGGYRGYGHGGYHGGGGHRR